MIHEKNQYKILNFMIPIVYRNLSITEEIPIWWRHLESESIKHLKSFRQKYSSWLSLSVSEQYTLSLQMNHKNKNGRP